MLRARGLVGGLDPGPVPGRVHGAGFVGPTIGGPEPGWTLAPEGPDGKSTSRLAATFI